MMGELDAPSWQLTTRTELEIINGRHPSVEAGLQASARVFTPNSTSMTPSSHLHVITGPNQGGKSTLLRQTAVIAILAQSGSYVPADSAKIGIVDRVFSRVGARDDLFRDRSTFMLEMVETAAILKYATPRSLVIMDEIGRGTTLNAGVSIAYATLHYILQNIGCRTLFATHYHELAAMLGAPRPSADSHSSVTPVPPDHPTLRPGVAFFCTDIDEMEGSFAYSYRLRPGVNYDSHAIVSNIAPPVCCANVVRKRPSSLACRPAFSRLPRRRSGSSIHLHLIPSFEIPFHVPICHS